MYYNNRKPNYSQGSTFRPFKGNRSQGAQYSPGFGRPQTGKKKSGAKMKQDKNGRACIVAWNAGKQGLRTLIASPISDEGLAAIAKVKGIDRSEFEFEGKTTSGNVFQRWFYKLTNKTTGELMQGRGFFHPATKKLYIPRLNMVASCGRNYFGTSRRPQGGR